jgi:hypothetical protein
VSGFQTDLLIGHAVLLASAGLGTWSTTGVYTTTQTGIVLGTVPQGPDRVITLSAYGVADDPSLSDSVMGLQVRCRWGGQDPRYVDDLADSIFAYLHGKEAYTLSTGIVVVQCHRISGPVSLGQDENRRWSNVQNFHLTVHRPSTNRF